METERIYEECCLEILYSGSGLKKRSVVVSYDYRRCSFSFDASSFHWTCKAATSAQSRLEKRHYRSRKEDIVQEEEKERRVAWKRLLTLKKKKKKKEVA